MLWCGTSVASVSQHHIPRERENKLEFLLWSLSIQRANANANATTCCCQPRKPWHFESTPNHGRDDFAGTFLPFGTKEKPPQQEKGGGTQAQTGTRIVGKIRGSHPAGLSCQPDGRSSALVSGLGTRPSRIFCGQSARSSRLASVGLPENETTTRCGPASGRNPFDRVHDTGFVSLASDCCVGDQ